MADRCIATVQAASGNVLSADEAMDVLEQVRQRKAAIEAKGLPQQGRLLRETAAADAERAKLKAALNKKHAVLSALARRNTQAVVIARMKTGLSYQKSIVSWLTGSTMFRNSVATTIGANEARYVGSLMGRMNAERPALRWRLDDEKLMEDATKLMMGEKVDSPDPDAQFLADLFSEQLSLARLDSNNFGANIGEIPGYVPQNHMDWRLMKVTQKAWVDGIYDRLDFTKTFPDVEPGAYRIILEEIYDNVTLGHDVDRTLLRNPDKAEKMFSGPANLARSLEKHRILHFKDAENYIAYNKEFGHGNLFSTVTSSLMKSARVNALMEHLGPNPGFTLDNLLDGMIAAVRKDTSLTQLQRDKIINEQLRVAKSSGEGGRKGVIGTAYRIVTGQSDIPINKRLEKVSSTVGGVQSMASLGTAITVALPTDIWTLSLNLKYHGEPYWSSLSKIITKYFGGRGKLGSQERTIAHLEGEGIDGIVGHFTHRLGSEEGFPGRISSAAQTFFTVTGLTPHTDTIRSVGLRIMAANMGRHAAKPFDKLSRRYQRVLGIYDITPEMWEIARETRWTGDNGTKYLTSDNIDELPAEAFDSLIGPQLAGIATMSEARLKQLQDANAREIEWLSGWTDEKVKVHIGRIAELDRRLSDLGALAAKIEDSVDANITELRAAIDARISDMSEAMDTIRQQRLDAEALAGAKSGAAFIELSTRLRKEAAARKAVRAGAGIGQKAGTDAQFLRSKMGELRKGANEKTHAITKTAMERLDTVVTKTLDAIKDFDEFATRSQERFDKRVEMETAETASVAKLVQRERERARRATSQAFKRFYFGESVQGVIEVDDSTKNLSTWGTQRGTGMGVLVRRVLAFKGFPLAFTSRVLGRQIKGQSAKELATSLPSLIVGAWVAGYAGMTLRELAKGNTPPDPTDWRNNVAAFLASGAAGIYGDFLFNVTQSTRNNTFLETVTGPGVSAIADIWTLYAGLFQDETSLSDAFSALWQNVPGQNIWFVRAALNTAILNQMREWMTPGYIARQDTRLRDRGQERILPPTLGGRTGGSGLWQQ